MSNKATPVLEHSLKIAGRTVAEISDNCSMSVAFSCQSDRHRRHVTATRGVLFTVLEYGVSLR